jgi:DNA repair protein RadD
MIRSMPLQESFFPADVAAPVPTWMRNITDPPAPKTPHGFQVSALDAVKASLRAGHRRVMLKLPTGGGKTVIGANIIASAREKGSRVLFVVNAISLVDQTVEKFWQAGIRSIGVTQGNHEMTDARQPVQVCSIQTLMRRDIPPADLVIIDEAHNWFRFYGEWMADPAWEKIPFIGLSATPYTKGLGKYYTDLVIASSTQELIDKGFLSPFKVFAPGLKADLSKVRELAGDYHEGDLAEAMNQPELVADVVKTWLEFSLTFGRRPTLCYAVDCAHARKLQEQFLAAGVPCAYMDADTEIEERREIGDKFARREIEVVSNVGVLTTGIDWDVRCLIIDRPTKSKILFQQIIGRGLRTAPGKDFCLILDHSPTHSKLGYVTDVDEQNQELDGGVKKPSQTKPKKERVPTECPKCHYLRPIHSRACPNCGFIPVEKKESEIENAEGELAEFGGKKEKFSKEQKAAFYGELLTYCDRKGYKPGWAAAKFKDKFGTWPNAYRAAEWREPTAETLSWIRSRNIAWAKRKPA